MTDIVKQERDFLLKREYRLNRLQENPKPEKRNDSSLYIKYAKDFQFTLNRETPVFYNDDIFGFNRKYQFLPYEERNFTANVTIDYEFLLKNGFMGLRDKVNKYDNGSDFYKSINVCIDACLDLANRYLKEAEKLNKTDLVCAIKDGVFYGAKDYYQALVIIKCITYCLRTGKVVHLTLGRFDQYMYPYYLASIKNGKTEQDILELTERFFIALNLDTDVYEGLQQGDNGQSIVLGGCDKKGNDCFNRLSEICLQASQELDLIDPKINLRVNKNTPISLYERGTLLTKMGMGFPQYSNDDIVIPGLVKLGYDLEDARDYAVAACWEFIIPKYSGDIPNMYKINYPEVIEKATKEYLLSSPDFNFFLDKVDALIKETCDNIVSICNESNYISHPLVSALISPCIKRGKGLFEGGAKYQNIGIHGTGFSTAADALAAIKLAVFEEKFTTKEELLSALENDFNGYEDLQKKLLACSKMGNNEDTADDLGKHIAYEFSKNLNGRKNSKGGVYRAGTGSAMGYVIYAKDVGATADGRRAGEPYASSYSPSLNARLNGPLSAIQSFTKLDLTNLCNGGPFTIEIHDTVFAHADGIKKVAQLVKTYIDLGGHQIQINSVNRDKLIEAQKHPELYPNLIVRVWGWSGYFNELDVEYQNHIIKRMEFSV